MNLVFVKRKKMLYNMRVLKIGNVNIKTNIMLAPMSGCSDLSFRLIAREMGAKFCFFEMVDANSLCYSHPKTLSILKTQRNDRPIAAQLLGAKPDIMLKAARKIIALTKISFLDINSACPARKVTSKSAGAYLLNDPGNLCKIIRVLSTSLPVPVTVKIRIGFGCTDLSEIVKLAKRCVKSGCSAIFVHGRTRAQGYAGEIDYKSIKAIKRAVRVPVIGSGNIFNGPMAYRMFEETGCDGILIARGSFGNPWIFREVETYLKTQKIIKAPAKSKKKAVLRKHLMLLDKHKLTGPAAKIGIMRKVTMWYLKGVPNASMIRDKICRAGSLRGLKKIITQS